MTAVAGALATVGWLGGSAVLVVLGYLRYRRAWAFLGAALNLLFIAAISASVFSEDRYYNDHRSRWSHRGDAPHTLYLLAMVSALAVAVLFAVFARRDPDPAIPRTALRLSGIGNL